MTAVHFLAAVVQSPSPIITRAEGLFFFYNEEIRQRYMGNFICFVLDLLLTFPHICFRKITMQHLSSLWSKSLSHLRKWTCRYVTKKVVTSDSIQKYGKVQQQSNGSNREKPAPTKRLKNLHRIPCRPTHLIIRCIIRSTAAVDCCGLFVAL